MVHTANHLSAWVRSCAARAVAPVSTDRDRHLEPDATYVPEEGSSPVHARTRQWFGALVAGCGLAAIVSAPAGAQFSGQDPPDLAAVDSFVRRELAAAFIPGAAMAITRRGSVLHIQGFGEDSSHRPVTGETRFRVASLSKSFTALAVMQLVEAGELELDDTVASHLPDFRLADPRGSRITVEQLLDQTSGLSDGEVSPMSRAQPTTPSEAVAALHGVRLTADPGTQWSYHNPNYQVAARLVEVLSGQPFADYLRDHVFGPAGMTHSTSTNFYDQPVDGLAEGHVMAFGQAVSMSPPHVFTAGDGGVVTTAADLARWLVVQGNDGLSEDGIRVLSPESTVDMHTGRPPTGYALGWDTSGPLASPTTVEHSGTVLTFSAMQAVVPESRYGVAIAFNASSPTLGPETAILHGVLDILEGKTDDPPGFAYPQRTLDAVLGVLAVTSLALGASGVARARRWARRRVTSRVRTIAGLLPLLAIVGLVAMFPTLLGSLLGGREVTWTTAAYGWPALVLLVLSLLLVSVSTAAARTWHLWRHRRSQTQAGSTGRSEGVRPELA